jgi:hypothetical protein
MDEEIIMTSSVAEPTGTDPLHPKDDAYEPMTIDVRVEAHKLVDEFTDKFFGAFVGVQDIDEFLDKIDTLVSGPPHEPYVVHFVNGPWDNKKVEAQVLVEKIGEYELDPQSFPATYYWSGKFE